MFDFLPKDSKRERPGFKLWNRFLRRSQEKVEEETKAATAALESVYEEELRGATGQMEAQFGQVAEAAQQDFGKFLVELREQAAAAQKTKIEEFNKIVDEALESFTAQLLTLVKAEEEKARQEVAAYKTAVMEKIDQKAALVVEKVAKIVIGKSLNASEQADLVIEAIDRAKKEEFLP